MGLYWTTEKPQEAGIYFARCLHPPEVEMYVEEPFLVISFVPGEKIRRIGGINDMEELDDYDEFAGPISMPRDSA
jgi:hypothetical protein